MLSALLSSISTQDSTITIAQGVIASYVFVFTTGLFFRFPLRILKSTSIFILSKSKYLGERFDPYYGQYGKYYILRKPTKEGDLIRINFVISRNIFHSKPRVYWKNDSLFPSRTARGHLHIRGRYFEAVLENLNSQTFTVIFPGGGGVIRENFCLGIQMGVSIITGNIYASEILIVRSQFYSKGMEDFFISNNISLHMERTHEVEQKIEEWIKNRIEVKN